MNDKEGDDGSKFGEWLLAPHSNFYVNIAASRRISRPTCLKIEDKGKYFEERGSYPRFLENFKLKWNWHTLRHKKASEWENSGMSIYEIMSRLGRSNM